MTIEETVEIARPPEVVYPLVRDLERAPEWQESLKSVDVHRGVEVRRFAGLRAESAFLIVDDDPPRRLVITSEGGQAYARATFELDPDGVGTVVRFTLELDLRGAARLGAGLVRPAAQKEARENLQRLKELAER